MSSRSVTVFIGNPHRCRRTTPAPTPENEPAGTSRPPPSCAHASLASSRRPLPSCSSTRSGSTIWRQATTYPISDSVSSASAAISHSQLTRSRSPSACARLGTSRNSRNASTPKTTSLSPNLRRWPRTDLKASTVRWDTACGTTGSLPRVTLRTYSSTDGPSCWSASRESGPAKAAGGPTISLPSEPSWVWRGFDRTVIPDHELRESQVRSRSPWNRGGPRCCWRLGSARRDGRKWTADAGSLSGHV